MRHGTAVAIRSGFACALLISVPMAARAQLGCALDVRAGAHKWQSPLDRAVSLQIANASMRDALDRIAESARIRLSYSSELVPLDRHVCVKLDSVAAGDALNALLHDVAFEPIVAGDDQVVLAPARRAEQASVQPQIASNVGVLDRVLVTSSIDDRERGATAATTMIARQQLSRGASSSLSELLDAAVPGLWLWNQSPASMLGSYGSIRGASSFGVSYPKMYIDGIEVANPLLVTHLDPELVDRIDVIRGPQGAALYGADAISGVVNVVTRHDGVDATGEWLRAHSNAGFSESNFSSHPVLSQEHGVTLRSGSFARSATLGVSAQTLGDYIPNAGSSELRAVGGLRVIGGRTTISGTARLFAKAAGSPSNPLIASLMPTASSARWQHRDFRGFLLGGDSAASARVRVDSGPQSVQQYTLGATLAFAQNERLTHTFVAGIDGYRLANASNGFTTLPSSPDAALLAASGAADRTTLRASSALRLGGEGRTAGSVTLSAEQSLLRDQTVAGLTSNGRDSLGAASWWTSSGLVAEASGSLDDAWYVTGGVRFERDAGTHTATLPMIGTAYVRDFGSITAKLRTAYGRGLRPARTAAREASWLGVRNVNTSNLAPEEQAGVEAGADLFIGRTVAFHVTRFDQRAYGLIQPVAVVEDGPWSSGMTGFAYTLQNIGEIANRGWELQSTLGIGRLSLTSALSLVDSRITRLSDEYTGDLRAGDRMLGVPATTASLSATWSAFRWRTSLGLSRASDWVNYDRLAIVRALTSSTTNGPGISSTDLRTFWRDYPGVTHLRGSFSRDITRRWAMLLTGENLLNQQRGEPDDLSLVPGRTVSFGLRAKF